MEYDRFSIYGFEVEYPKDWRVELNPKSEKKRGDAAFHFPKRDRMFVSWGMLEEAKKKYASLDEHVDGTIERVKKGRGVKSVEVVERKELEMNRHRAIFTRLKVTLIQAFFLKRKEVMKEIWSSHLYCEQAGRYFVVYGSSSLNERAMEHAKVFKHMQESFRCQH